MSEKSSLSIGLMRKERQRKYTCIVATSLRLSLARSNQRKQCIMSRLLEERKNPYETIILFVSGSFAQTELSRCSGGETLRDSARYRCIFLCPLGACSLKWPATRDYYGGFIGLDRRPQSKRSHMNPFGVPCIFDRFIPTSYPGAYYPLDLTQDDC